MFSFEYIESQEILVGEDFFNTRRQFGIQGEVHENGNQKHDIHDWNTDNDKLRENNLYRLTRSDNSRGQ